MAEQPQDAEQKHKLDIDWLKTAAGALAAVTTAVLLSTLGAVGTLVGAALGSVAATIGTSLYAQGLARSRETVVKVQETALHKVGIAQAEVRRAGRRAEDEAALEAHLEAADERLAEAKADLDEVVKEETTRTWADRVRALPWKRIALLAAATFVVVLLAITAFELLSGRSVSSYTGGSDKQGSTIGGVTGDEGGSKEKDKNKDEQPSEQPSEEPRADRADAHRGADGRAERDADPAAQRDALTHAVPDPSHRASDRHHNALIGACRPEEGIPAQEEHVVTFGRITMTTAREIMTAGAECAQVNETLVDAARKMRDLDVGALPICGDDNRLKGMITDRDIVVKCIAEGRDPSTVKVEEFGGVEVVTIGADDSVEEALSTMTRYGVRRLPVIDGHDLVGMVSQADVAKNLPEEKVGQLVEAISAAPPNN